MEFALKKAPHIPGDVRGKKKKKRRLYCFCIRCGWGEERGGKRLKAKKTSASKFRAGKKTTIVQKGREGEEKRGERRAEPLERLFPNRGFHHAAWERKKGGNRTESVLLQKLVREERGRRKKGSAEILGDENPLLL